jgi:hypothetical protein
MNDALGGPLEQPGARLPLTLLYMRAIALIFLVVGLARACLVLGITPDGQNFDVLAPEARVGTTTLLLVDLFAAVGLWVGAAWGPVMWAVALAVEVSMYTLFSGTFGSYPIRIFIHTCLFVGFLALTFAEWRRQLAD